MKKKEFAFDKMNFILLAVGMLIVIAGMVLMSGSGSTEETFNPATSRWHPLCASSATSS